jgi:hypothetical protein
LRREKSFSINITIFFFLYKRPSLLELFKLFKNRLKQKAIFPQLLNLNGPKMTV